MVVLNGEGKPVNNISDLFIKPKPFIPIVIDKTVLFTRKDCAKLKNRLIEKKNQYRHDDPISLISSCEDDCLAYEDCLVGQGLKPEETLQEIEDFFERIINEPEEVTPEITFTQEDKEVNETIYDFLKKEKKENESKHPFS